MEITYSRVTNYSLELDKKAQRELADHLDSGVSVPKKKTPKIRRR